MAKYQYIAKDIKGGLTKGEIEANSKKSAEEAISSQSLTPVQVKEINETFFSELRQKLGHVPATEKVMFSKQLATLISAGVPISQSMRILERQTKNKILKSAINAIGSDIEAGLSLSSSMEKQSRVFSPLYVSLVSSGEAGGSLDKSLERMADEIEKEHDLVSSIRGAMSYPMIILVAMIGVVVYMLSTIVPQLAGIFAEMGGELPAATRMLLKVSDLIRTQGFLILVALVGSVVGFRTLLVKNKNVRYGWHKMLLKIPIFGQLMSKVNITRFTRTFGSLLSSGVNVLEAMKISANTIQNEVFKTDILKAADDVKNGVTIAEALKKTKNFPVILAEMIAVGEETGSLDNILDKVTSFYQKEVDGTIKNLSSLVEPLMMIIIGVGVGTIVVAVIQPVYSMTNLF